VLSTDVLYLYVITLWDGKYQKYILGGFGNVCGEHNMEKKSFYAPQVIFLGRSVPYDEILINHVYSLRLPFFTNSVAVRGDCVFLPLYAEHPNNRIGKRSDWILLLKRIVLR